ncbi:MAG: carbohydrate ABC transporter substrate-binding protein [Chloroflexi bacterium]|nr:carbohydrate ABC transporter substrate-binding protein [Chloroflexota bacterium]
MKKALLITVLASVLVMALGFGMASAQEPVTLVYWSMWNETEGQARVLQAAIASFEAANPNVTIDAVWNGRQNQTLVRTAISGGNQVIDLMDQDADQIAGGLMREGFALPLNDYLAQPAEDHEEPLMDVFLPGTLQMFSLDDQIYQLPYIYNTVQFWYDKRVFEEVGLAVPQTWDELLAACTTLNDAGYAPIAAEGNEPGYAAFYLTELLARTKGPGWLQQAAADPTGEMWRDPAVLDAAQRTRALWDNGCIPPETLGYVWPQGQNTLAFGTAAMELVGSWLPVELQNATDPEFQWGGFSFPAIEGGVGSTTDVYALLLAFMINKDTAHPDEAFAFLRHLMTDAVQQQFTDESLVGVTNKYIQWNPIIADALAAASAATSTYGDVDGVASLYSEYLNTILYPNYVSLWQAAITPEDFVETMATQSAQYWADHPQS